MDIINAIILGIIQGLTEFLPVSSSGHLEIFKVLLGENKMPGESLLMTVILHFATACSTIVIFKNDIKELILGLITFEKNDSFWFSGKILISMIPAVLIGFFLEAEIELLFSGDLLIVGYMLILTGFLLFMADKAKPSEKKINIKSSIIIGISQAIAIIPGISRSGATISTAVLLGIDKENAAKFSFLMVVPLIFGKVLKDLTSSEVLVNNNEILPLIFGFIFAFITGILACKWMIKLVKNSKLKYFSIYCFIVGTLSIISTL
ncbi:MAG: undecaprenyl-diphosphate phosphatase [Flavobacteriales bacterium]